MMNSEYFLDENTAVWCPAKIDGTDLAYYAEFAIANRLDYISVSMDSVKTLWPWLENQNIKIMCRFYLDTKFDFKNNLSNLVTDINSAFKQGADGIQLFVRISELDRMVEQLYTIRDDLFFNKEVFIGLDLNDIETCNFDKLWNALNKFRVNGLVIAFPVDKGDKSDFVGRIYGLLDSWQKNTKIKLHFVLGENLLRIEQVKRLTQSMQSDLMPDIRFFVNI